MRVALLAGNGSLDRQHKRILKTHNINGDIVPSITNRILSEYDILVLSANHDIPNVPVVIEQIVLEQRIHVVYIGKTASIGRFYNVVNDPFFHLIQEWTADIELPLLIQTIAKFHKRISMLQHQTNKLETRLETLESTNKAKRILMKQGMSEQEAHQFIQKKAMDMRVSKKRLVSLIIENKIDI